MLQDNQKMEAEYGLAQTSMITNTFMNLIYIFVEVFIILMYVISIN